MIDAKATLTASRQTVMTRAIGAPTPPVAEERAGMATSWPEARPSARLSDARLPPPGAHVLRGPTADIVLCRPEFSPFIRRNHSVESLRDLGQILHATHVSEVPLLPSNLVPAGEVSEVSAAFGYSAAWYRDTALIGLAYRDDRSLKITEALAHNALTDNQVHRFLTGIARGRAASDPKDMPQIKISADGSDLKGTWGHNQLDALGISLFTMLQFSHVGSDDSAVTDQIKAGALISAYLERIDFVRVPCNGHWEESGPHGEGAILTSSLGCVVLGLKAMARWIAKDPARACALDDYLRALDGTDNGFGEKLRTVRPDGGMVFSFAHGDLDAAIANGVSTIRSRHVDGEWLETFKDALGRKRGSDLALTSFVILELQTPEKDRVLSRAELIGLVGQLERDLKGPLGYRRYHADGWLAAYPGADGRDPEARARIALNIADRNWMTPGTSPEWTLGNGAMAQIFGRLYLEIGDVRYRDKANENLNRLLGNITATPDGDKHLIISELFMHAREGDQFRYVANGLNLSWSRAFMHMAVDTLCDVAIASAERAAAAQQRIPELAREVA